MSRSLREEALPYSSCSLPPAPPGTSWGRLPSAHQRGAGRTRPGAFFEGAGGKLQVLLATSPLCHAGRPARRPCGTIASATAQLALVCMRDVASRQRVSPRGMSEPSASYRVRSRGEGWVEGPKGCPTLQLVGSSNLNPWHMCSRTCVHLQPRGSPG